MARKRVSLSVQIWMIILFLYKLTQSANIQNSPQSVNPETYKQGYTDTEVQGRRGWGGDETPPLGFHYVAIFRKDFTFSRKPVMCTTPPPPPHLVRPRVNRFSKIQQSQLIVFQIAQMSVDAITQNVTINVETRSP